MSVWKENFGRTTESKGAGSRSAWRFDLLWKFFCGIVCSPTSKKIHQPPLITTALNEYAGSYQINCINKKFVLDGYLIALRYRLFIQSYIHNSFDLFFVK